MFFLEKENKFVRFHAIQSILFGIVVFVVWKFSVLSITIFIGIFLLPFIAFGTFLFWLLLMWRAYNNEKWRLPYIGKIAEEQANK